MCWFVLFESKVYFFNCQIDVSNVKLFRSKGSKRSEHISCLCNMWTSSTLVTNINRKQFVSNRATQGDLLLSVMVEKLLVLFHLEVNFVVAAPQMCIHAFLNTVTGLRNTVGQIKPQKWMKTCHVYNKNWENKFNVKCQI